MTLANHTITHKPKLTEKINLNLHSDNYINKTIDAHSNDAANIICTQVINQGAGVISALTDNKQKHVIRK